jgi:hypothetical protein
MSIEGESSTSASRSLDARVLHRALSASLFGSEAGPAALGPYHLVRRIGAGGMGLVFEACDSRTGQRLALKILRERGPQALQRLKREFRALSDLHHPNLVQLYELSIDGHDPFITMELVEGCRLVEYVRPAGQLDPARLEHVLRQLIDAVSTLHAAGKLHRDLKPSNLLVRPDGQLVLLDFGLAQAVGGGDEASGTPAYMAPERLLGQPATTASDWFSVGVLAHEALRTVACAEDIAAGEDGVLVHEAPVACAQDIATSAHAAPRDHLGHLALDLLQLSTRLRDSDPAARPSSEELRAAFGLPALEASPLPPVGFHGLETPFVGREGELERLHDTFARVATGACAIVYLHGEPGIGKSALAKRFMEQLRSGPSTLLAGRCYEHELIPYNAADGLVDALAQHLEQLPEGDPARAPREGASELVRLFPALRGAFQGDVADLGTTSVDPHRLRQRAFAALRALVQALAASSPLVIHLDDLQWGDVDSAQLLLELLAAPAPAPLLFIASYRTADKDGSACVRALQESWPLTHIDVHELEVGPLLDEPALTLARGLAQGSLGEGTLLSLTKEAGGSPLFLRALVLHQVRASSSEITLGATSFQQLLGSALLELPEPSRELLYMITLAGRPIARELLLRASAHIRPDATWAQHLARLQRTGLARGVRGPGGMLESYHDRVRTGVAETIEPAMRRRLHAALAAAEATSRQPDAEFLAYQYLGAGERDNAARFAEVAGDRAFDAVALERAAELYTLALDGAVGPRSPALIEKLANAIAFSGRCEQAAPLYLEAAEASDPQRALKLRLRAAEMLLRAGRFAASTEVAKPVLRAVGLGYPRSIPGVLLSVVADAAKIELRIRRRPIHEILPHRAPTAREELRAEVSVRAPPEHRGPSPFVLTARA